MYDLEKRQQAAAEREARKAAKQALVERQEREKQAKQKMEEDAYEMQLQVLLCSVALREHTANSCLENLGVAVCWNCCIAALAELWHTAYGVDVQVD